ncbi:hypothetical protein ACWCW7_18685 [Nocardia tengchongensis]
MDYTVALSVIDDLLTRPFPDDEIEDDFSGDQSGPGYHLLDLARTETCYSDDDWELKEADNRAYEADLAGLQAKLRARWGEGELLTLWDGNAAVSPPVQTAGYSTSLRKVADWVGSVHIWRVGQRWVTAFVGQADKELFIQLRVAVGLTSDLP